jgi:hypothetical protein
MDNARLLNAAGRADAKDIINYKEDTDGWTETRPRYIKKEELLKRFPKAPKPEDKTKRRRHVGMKPLSKALQRELADHDLVFNPAMATYAGAMRWKNSNESRRNYKVGVADQNGDGIPEVLVADPDGHIVWACGHRIKQSDRPYRDWYHNEKAMNPELFKKHGIKRNDFRDDMYGATTNYSTGITTITNADAAKRFENYVRSQGYAIRRPKNLSAYQLWQMRVFKPVYDVMAGCKTNQTSQLYKTKTFGYIATSAPIYNALIIEPIFAAWEIPLPGEAGSEEFTDYRLSKIKSSKEFKRAVLDLVRNRTDHKELPTSWKETSSGIRQLYDYMRAALGEKFPTMSDPSDPTKEVFCALAPEAHWKGSNALENFKASFRNTVEGKVTRTEERRKIMSKRYAQQNLWNYTERRPYNPFDEALVQNKVKANPAKYGIIKKDKKPVRMSEALYQQLYGPTGRLTAERDYNYDYNPERDMAGWNPKENKLKPDEYYVNPTRKRWTEFGDHENLAKVPQKMKNVPVAWDDWDGHVIDSGEVDQAKGFVGVVRAKLPEGVSVHQSVKNYITNVILQTSESPEEIEQRVGEVADGLVQAFRMAAQHHDALGAIKEDKEFCQELQSAWIHHMLHPKSSTKISDLLKQRWVLNEFKKTHGRNPSEEEELGIKRLIAVADVEVAQRKGVFEQQDALRVATSKNLAAVGSRGRPAGPPADDSSARPSEESAGDTTDTSGGDTTDTSGNDSGSSGSEQPTDSSSEPKPPVVLDVAGLPVGDPNDDGDEDMEV